MIEGGAGNQYDIIALTTLLETLQQLKPRNLKQSKGVLYRGVKNNGEVDGRCSACVGAWAAFALGKGQRGIVGSSHWHYGDGIDALEDVLHQPFPGRLLKKHGAPRVPFGLMPWMKHPYDVFRDAIEELTGYRHGENWPIRVEDYPIIVSESNAVVEVLEEIYNEEAQTIQG